MSFNWMQNKDKFEINKTNLELNKLDKAEAQAEEEEEEEEVEQQQQQQQQQQPILMAVQIQIRRHVKQWWNLPFSLRMPAKFW